MGLKSMVTGLTDSIGLTDSGAGDRAYGAQSAAADKANKTLKQTYNESKRIFKPWQEQGENAFNQASSFANNYENFSNAENPMRDHNGVFTMKDFQEDPGYQFRMQEGQKALERTAAAKGSLNSGATLKALSRYGQDMASNEYGNAYNRFNQDYSNSYNRYNNDNAQRFNQLNTIANYGQNANSTLAEQGMNYGNNVASNAIGLGNAAANNEMHKGDSMKGLWEMGMQGAAMMSGGI